ncbi:MAG TPA: hypothetical protein VKI01_03890 [Acidimicrobiia bacterium]|nr:hypothetical protein [Acidimicrobiia bacterium]
MNPEGWYHDPFRLHEARWFSDGNPTALVRDGRVESRDDPPSSDYEAPLEPIDDGDESSPDDLRRADDGQSDLPPEERVWEVGLGETSALD